MHTNIHGRGEGELHHQHILIQRIAREETEFSRCFNNAHTYSWKEHIADNNDSNNDQRPYSTRS